MGNQNGLIILSNDSEANIVGRKKPLSGGVERFLRDFSRTHRAHGGRWIGITSLVADCAHPTLLPVTSRERARFLRLTIRSRAWSRGVYGGKEDPGILLQEEIDLLHAKIRKLAPDIIFINGTFAFPWLLFRAARTLGIPTVLLHHGIFAVEISHATTLSSSVKRVLSGMEREMTDGVGRNIFLNEFAIRAYEHSHGARLRDVHVVPLPFAWQSKYPQPLRPRARNLRRIGMVARWDPVKGHDNFLSLASIGERKKENFACEFISVTTLPASSKTPQGKKLARAYPRSISVVSPMGRTELRSFYRKLDLIVVPSRFDISPTVVMEALAEGVPVLLSPNTGWTSEFERASAGEWIISFDDPGGVLDRIIHHFSRKTWPEMERLRRAIGRDHDPDHVYQLLLREMRSFL